MHQKTKKQKLKIISLFIIVGFFSSALFYTKKPHSQIPDNDNDSSVTINTPRRADNIRSTDTTTKDDSVEESKPARSIIKNNRITSKKTITEDGKTYINHVYTAQFIPNDTYAGQSWESEIGLAASRDIATGAYKPKLAIIDTGVSLNHEDLDGLWLTNPGEGGIAASEAPSKLNCTDRALPLNMSCNLIDDDLNGTVDDESGNTSLENKSQLNCTDQGLSRNKSCNLIDDDSNGLVDDYIGYDFANNDRSVMPGQVNPNGEGVSHGTYVTGSAAAINNNAKGVAGISSNVEILPLQALEDSGSGYSSAVADAIWYAIEQDVDIISMSLGSPGDDPYTALALRDAAKQGITIIAASGNSGCSCIFYPAANPQVIAVGASDGATFASFSNYGDMVDVIAPGVNIISSKWTSTNPTSGYGYVSGTSIATPIVSGLAATLISHQPALSPLQLRALLTEETQTLLGATVPHDIRSGFGKISAIDSISRITTPLTTAQINKFLTVRYGQSHSSWDRTDFNKPLSLYSCNNGNPSTPIYRLSKSNTRLYTASLAEKAEASSSGFATTFMFYGCILFEHDTPGSIRTLNIASEFENTTDRKILY